MAELEPGAQELLDGPFPCALTTLRRDGSPVTVVVWCGREGNDICVNAGARTAWLARLRNDPRASLAVVDTTNIHHYLEAGTDVVSIEVDEGFAHIDGLAKVYYQMDHWPRREYGDEPRYKVTLRPHRVTVSDLPWPDEVAARRSA